MSGNSSQRKQEKDRRHLLELGRAQKAKESEIEALHLRLREVEQIAQERASRVDALLRENAALKADIERFTADSTSEVARLEKLCCEAAERFRHREFESLDLSMRLSAALLELESLKAGGLVTRSEHEAVVSQETRKLRKRLRRKSELLASPRLLRLDGTEGES